MARYVQQFRTNFAPAQVSEFMNSFMRNEGFSYINYNGEYVWKKGVGLLTAPQYIKLSQTNNGYVIEAWIKVALLPGVYVGEMGIDGGFGAIPKKLLKDKVNAIFGYLQAQLFY